mmetsp:Transcript_10748/g.33154  ORF Transcript_10748/g.33154 Transcript_10748/m.33154 type:complete len:323 (-) Transcript_10748:2503-3471(-)
MHRGLVARTGEPNAAVQRAWLHVRARGRVPLAATHTRRVISAVLAFQYARQHHAPLRDARELRSHGNAQSDGPGPRKPVSLTARAGQHPAEPRGAVAGLPFSRFGRGVAERPERRRQKLQRLPRGVPPGPDVPRQHALRVGRVRRHVPRGRQLFQGRRSLRLPGLRRRRACGLLFNRQPGTALRGMPARHGAADARQFKRRRGLVYSVQPALVRAEPGDGAVHGMPGGLDDLRQRVGLDVRGGVRLSGRLLFQDVSHREVLRLSAPHDVSRRRGPAVPQGRVLDASVGRQRVRAAVGVSVPVFLLLHGREALQRSSATRAHR